MRLCKKRGRLEVEVEGSESYLSTESTGDRGVREGEKHNEHVKSRGREKEGRQSKGKVKHVRNWDEVDVCVGGAKGRRCTDYLSAESALPSDLKRNSVCIV